MTMTARPASDGAWDPRRYAQFGDHRSRPFFDLVAQVRATQPRVVVDLGCGPGNLTLTLADRWPTATVLGVDNSAEMLDAAHRSDPDRRVEWVAGCAEDLDLTAVAERAGAPVDVLVTNATLQWVPTHLRLIPRWLDGLATGGTFAMQVPSNFAAPSHALMRQVARRHRRSGELSSALDRADAVAEARTYAELLLGHPRVAAADVWTTTFLHVLDATDFEAGHAEHPVLAWVRSTGLRPVLGLLTEPGELEDFLAEYRGELAQAYPVSSGRVILPFQRIFAVAQVS